MYIISLSLSLSPILESHDMTTGTDDLLATSPFSSSVSEAMSIKRENNISNLLRAMWMEVGDWQRKRPPPGIKHTHTHTRAHTRTQKIQRKRCLQRFQSSNLEPGRLGFAIANKERRIQPQQPVCRWPSLHRQYPSQSPGTYTTAPNMCVCVYVCLEVRK